MTDDAIFHNFRDRYRGDLKRTSVPTACLLDGQEVDRDFLSRSGKLLGHEQLFVLHENARRLEVYSATQVFKYLDLEESRDLDICVFPADLSWCLGVTHNDSSLLVDKEGVFGRPTASGLNPTLEYYKRK